jgi:hypothetical protein
VEDHQEHILVIFWEKMENIQLFLITPTQEKNHAAVGLASLQ